jgi:hypothetical protein
MEVAMSSTCSSYEGVGNMYGIFVGKALGKGDSWKAKKEAEEISSSSSSEIRPCVVCSVLLKSMLVRSF